MFDDLKVFFEHYDELSENEKIFFCLCMRSYEIIVQEGSFWPRLIFKPLEKNYFSHTSFECKLDLFSKCRDMDLRSYENHMGERRVRLVGEGWRSLNRDFKRKGYLFYLAQSIYSSYVLCYFCSDYNALINDYQLFVNEILNYEYCNKGDHFLQNIKFKNINDDVYEIIWNPEMNDFAIATNRYYRSMPYVFGMLGQFSDLAQNKIKQEFKIPRTEDFQKLYVEDSSINSLVRFYNSGYPCSQLLEKDHDFYNININLKEKTEFELNWLSYGIAQGKIKLKNK